MFLFTFLPFRKTLLFITLLVITGFGIKTYLLYKKMRNAPSYQESVELTIQHKEIFLLLYKLRPIQEFLVNMFYREQAKSMSESFEDWLESRIMDYIEQHPEITEIKQLPYLERSILLALDSPAYVSSKAQQGINYIMGRKKT